VATKNGKKWARGEQQDFRECQSRSAEKRRKSRRCWFCAAQHPRCDYKEERGSQPW